MPRRPARTSRASTSHRPDRDREGARRRARARDRLSGGRRRASRSRGRDVRQGLVDLRDHVRARPRGRRGELARVTKPGGRLALANWTPTGGIGRMFKVMAPYVAAPPPSSPFAWGDETRVRELLGDAFELEIEERISTLRVPLRRGLLGSLLDELRADEDPRRVARRAPRRPATRLGRVLRVQLPVGRGDRAHARVAPRARDAPLSTEPSRTVTDREAAVRRPLRLAPTVVPAARFAANARLSRWEDRATRRPR